MLHNKILKRVKRAVKQALHTSLTSYEAPNGDTGASAYAQEINTKYKALMARINKDMEDTAPNLDDLLNAVFETGDTTPIRELCMLADQIDGIQGNKKSAFDLMNDINMATAQVVNEIHSSTANSHVSENERAKLQVVFQALRKQVDLAEESLQVGQVEKV